jgi:DNA-binding transcriptional regulator YiaG
MKRNPPLKRRLLTMRKSLGLSQPQMAQRLKVCPRTLWAWEKGRSKPTKIVECGVLELLDNMTAAKTRR